MKKLFITVATLTALNAKSQFMIGINADLGNSKISTNFQNNLYPETVSGGGAFGIGVNTNFNFSKRFNPIINIGYIVKNSISEQDVNAFKVDSMGNRVRGFSTDVNSTLTTINGLKLDVCLRFNILNRKNKLFVQLGLSNNIILSVKNTKTAPNKQTTNFETTPSTPYYVSLPMGFGYNLNNKFSVAFIYNPALTFYDSQYNSKVNMFGLNFCYYLPILGNKKQKAEGSEPSK